MAELYCVYWIKHDKHTDYNREGYIGITKNMKERVKEHSKMRGGCKHLYSAMKKYPNSFSMIVLVNNLDKESAQLIEEMLRLEEKIGWNLAIGGGYIRNGNPVGSKYKTNGSRNLGSAHPNYKGAILATNLATGEVLRFEGQKEIDEHPLGFLQCCVYRCLKGQDGRTQHKGFKWEREVTV